MGPSGASIFQRSLSCSISLSEKASQTQRHRQQALQGRGRGSTKPVPSGVAVTFLPGRQLLHRQRWNHRIQIHPVATSAAGGPYKMTVPNGTLWRQRRHCCGWNQDKRREDRQAPPVRGTASCSSLLDTTTLLWFALCPSSGTWHVAYIALNINIAISFLQGSSRPRDWTWVSSIAGRFLTFWATREAPLNITENANQQLKPQSVPSHIVTWNACSQGAICLRCSTTLAVFEQ